MNRDEMRREILAWHLHSRRKHRTECQCERCSFNGTGPCSEERPCEECRKFAAASPRPAE